MVRRLPFGCNAYNKFVYYNHLEENRMKRTLITLSGLIAVLALTGCTTGTNPVAPAANKQAVVVPAQADILLAEKIKGEWTGEVKYAVGGGDEFDFPAEKMALVAASADGATLTLEQASYSTTSDATTWPKIKAVVEKGVLKAEQGGARKFELKMLNDNELTGDYHYLGTIWTVRLKRTK
jgi:hypothetical protein